MLTQSLAALLLLSSGVTPPPNPGTHKRTGNGPTAKYGFTTVARS